LSTRLQSTDTVLHQSDYVCIVQVRLCTGSNAVDSLVFLESNITESVSNRKSEQPLRVHHVRVCCAKPVAPFVRFNHNIFQTFCKIQYVSFDSATRRTSRTNVDDKAVIVWPELSRLSIRKLDWIGMLEAPSTNP